MPLPVDALIATLQAVTRSYYAGDIGPLRWAASVGSELKNAHIAQAIAGAGGRGSVSLKMWAKTTVDLTKEYGHLATLAQGMLSGKKSQAQMLASMKQYAQATQQAYWNTWRQARYNPAWKDLPLLTQVPGDGATDCHGNCKCHLEETEKGIYWRLGPAEKNCTQCPTLANGGPYRVI